MADTATDEGFLLALLNSTPVIDGVPADDLADPVRARAWLAAAGGRGHRGRTAARAAGRQALQRSARPAAAAVLAPELQGVTSVPAIDDGRIGWTLSVAPDRELAVRTILTWDALTSGRVRDGSVRAPTTNAACSSSIAARPTPPGGARWPSAATG